MTDREQELANEYNRRQAKRELKRLFWTIGLMAASAGAAALVWHFTRSCALTLPVAGLIAVFAFFALDAWETWREVRQRNWYRISPIQGKPRATPAKADAGPPRE